MLVTVLFFIKILKVVITYAKTTYDNTLLGVLYTVYRRSCGIF